MPIPPLSSSFQFFPPILPLNFSRHNPSERGLVASRPLLRQRFLRSVDALHRVALSRSLGVASLLVSLISAKVHLAAFARAPSAQWRSATFRSWSRLVAFGSGYNVAGSLPLCCFVGTSRGAPGSATVAGHVRHRTDPSELFGIYCRVAARTYPFRCSLAQSVTCKLIQ